jgi:hypothetical protein
LFTNINPTLIKQHNDNMMTKRRKAVLVTLLGLVPLPAFAYVDPGSGMLLMQGLIAAIGAVVVFAKNPVESFRKLWQRIRGK